MSAHHAARLFADKDSGWVIRRAKLFESGEFPDKGITVSEDQLAVIAGNFSEPVPVLIEHGESPIELGFLTAIEAVGSELFGEIKLSSEAHALVEKNGAKSLSVGLSPDLGHVREVSLVRTPRIADARLFHFHCGGLVDGDIAGPNWQTRYQELERRIWEEQIEHLVQGYLQQGKLSPAQAPMARALLGAVSKVQFNGNQKPIAELFCALMDQQPPNPLFREHVPAGPSAATPPTMLPEEAAFYRRYFPDIDLAAIAQVKR
jgi:hypothetical protein